MRDERRRDRLHIAAFELSGILQDPHHTMRFNPAEAGIGKMVSDAGRHIIVASKPTQDIDHHGDCLVGGNAHPGTGIVQL